MRIINHGDEGMFRQVREGRSAGGEDPTCIDIYTVSNRKAAQKKTSSLFDPGLRGRQEKNSFRPTSKCLVWCGCKTCRFFDLRLRETHPRHTQCQAWCWHKNPLSSTQDYRKARDIPNVEHGVGILEHLLPLGDTAAAEFARSKYTSHGHEGQRRRSCRRSSDDTRLHITAAGLVLCVCLLLGGGILGDLRGDILHVARICMAMWWGGHV